MTTYYIADPHFGHANIIRFENRPFESVEEMDAWLVEAWNARVGDDDDVYIVGDFAYRSATSVKSIVEKLHSRKHLVIGNHDAKWMRTFKPEDHFVEMGHALYNVDEKNRRVWMCHYPCMTWPGAHYEASYHVYGHIHGSKPESFWPLLSTYDRALNAGVEVNGYMPVTLEELIVNNERWRNGA